jgi:hypothetical protein
MKEYPWKTTFTDRAIYVSNFIPKNSSVLDIGGGLGELNNYLNNAEYNSIDIEKWNDFTIKADLNNKKEFPKIKEKRDFVICLGIIEYIKDASFFLYKMKEYSNTMIISYRRNTNGGMERKNNFDILEFKWLLEDVGWKVLFNKKIKTGDYIFFCSNKKNERY